MWNTILAVNSFVLWPLSIIFVIYSTGRLLLFFEWKIFILGVMLFILVTGVEMVLGILAD